MHQIRYVLSENKELSTKEITIKNAEHTKELMMENSPIIAEKVNQGETKIVTAYYKIATGKISFY